jgi:hypothetical protein
MEIQEALRIMRALADGVNPANGEALMADAVYPCAPVVRTFHRAVGARPRAFQKGAARNAENRGLEEKINRFARSCAGEMISTRSRRHNRTIGSIIARLVKLGKIGPNTPLDMFDPKVA